jgi:hypothetical protein
MPKPYQQHLITFVSTCSKTKKEMCVFKRFVFKCNHNSWGKEARACQKQRNYRALVSGDPCTESIAHPLHTITLSQKCDYCVRVEAERTKQKKRQDEIILKIRETLAGAKAKLKKWQTNEPSKASTTTVSEADLKRSLIDSNDVKIEKDEAWDEVA